MNERKSSSESKPLPKVFINCPFDIEYQQLFEAIRFTLIVNGFNPISSKDSSDSGEIRIQKIIKYIKSVQFSIHDISRTELDKHNNLPRFNMPLELGLTLGKKYFLANNRDKILILDKEEYRFQKFISDIAGQDILSHNNSVSGIIKAIGEWLTKITSKQIQSASFIILQHELFMKQKAELCEKNNFDVNDLSYKDYNDLVKDFHVEYQKSLLNKIS